MTQPYYQRRDKAIRERVNAPGVIGEFEAERDTLDTAFENVYAAISAISGGNAESQIPFYEGDVPPPMVDIDSFHFEDAAAFSPSVDQDIIFRLDPAVRYGAGVKPVLRFCMSTAHAGTVKLRFDYRVKMLGDPVDGGTDYTQTVVVDPSNLAEQIELCDALAVPAGIFTANTAVVHCRLSRLGASGGVQDSHTGIFCLLSIEPKVG